MCLTSTDYLIFLNDLLTYVPQGEDIKTYQETVADKIINNNIMFKKEDFFKAIQCNIILINRKIRKMDKEKDLQEQKMDMI